MVVIKPLSAMEHWGANMRTIGGIMDENNGIGPGFDLLRVALASAVILRHCFPISYGNGPEASAGVVWLAMMSIVPIFFILSGFLVTGSALRLALGKFCWSRTLRIVPALAVDTIVTLLLIGPLFTTIDIGSYFRSPVTHAYLLNIVGEIHYHLPGVFETNPLPAVVNGALWTIPPELGCYVVMAALIFFKWVRDWRKVTGVLLFSVALIVLVPLLPLETPPLIRKILAYQGAMLVPNFLLGSLLYLKRHAIPYSPPLFWACVATIVVTGFVLPDSTFSSLPAMTILASPFYAYVMMFIGATRLPSLPLFRRGDYSYGMYLYGFPIQQGIVAATGIKSPFLLFALTLGPVIVLAMASWHLIEKPTLRLRKGFSMAARIEEGRDKAS